MAASKKKRSNAFYRAALLGVRDRNGEISPALRSIAEGFTAKDGYTISNIDKWTPAMKARVTRYWQELQSLTAQEKVIVKTTSKQKLAQAQAIGGHSKGFKFKVAFVPGSKNAKVEWTKEGMRIREPHYNKVEIPFNQKSLARDAKKEVQRVLNLPEAERAKRFQIQAGKNLIGAIYDRGSLYGGIHNLMMKYDGVKQLPKSSGNRGDNPKSHHWRNWLFGVVGYEFNRDPDKVQPSAFREMADKNLEIRKRRRAMRQRLERSGAVKPHARKGKIE